MPHKKTNNPLQFTMPGRHTINFGRDIYDTLQIHASTLAIAAASAGSAYYSIGPIWAGTVGSLSLIFTAAAHKIDIANTFSKALKQHEVPAQHAITKEVHRLAKQAELESTPRVFYADILAEDDDMTRGMPFAAAAGTSQSGIVLINKDFDTQVPPRSIRSIIAHEIEHIRQGDTRTKLKQSMLAMPAKLTWTVSFWTTVLSILPFISAPSFKQLGIAFLAKASVPFLEAATSRAKERRADRGAVALTKNPWALSNGLKRIIELHGISITKKTIKEDIGLFGRLKRRMLKSHPAPEYRIKRLEKNMADKVRKKFPEQAQKLEQITNYENQLFDYVHVGRTARKKMLSDMFKNMVGIKDTYSLISTLKVAKNFRNSVKEGISPEDLPFLMGAKETRTSPDLSNAEQPQSP